jgi:hypothetical protein
MANLIENNLMGEQLSEFQDFINDQDSIGETCLYSCYTNTDMYNELCDLLQADKIVDKRSILVLVSLIESCLDSFADTSHGSIKSFYDFLN